MNKYLKYKPSNIPWLGDVPEHWEVRTLRQILSQVSVKNQPELPLLSVVRDKGVIIRNDDNDESDNHNRIPDDLSNYKVVEIGQFAMNKMKAWQGSYGISKYKGIVSPAYFVFNVVFPNLDFFHYAIRSKVYVACFGQASDGIRVDQWDLSLQKMKEICFVFPPLAEQTQIVHYLDEKLQKINKLTDAKKKQIELLKEQKQAMINEAVRNEWKRLPLKRLLIEPLQYGANDSGVVFNEDLPRYVRITDISSDGKLKDDEKKSLSNEVARQYLLSEGDVLLARSGATAGKTFLYETKYGICAFAGYLIRAKFDKKQLLPKFFIHYTNSSFYEEWKNSIFIQATIQNISAERYNYLQIPLPPFAEQQKIVTYLDKKTAKIDTVIEKIEQDISLLGEYRSRLISDVVTGKVNVQVISVDTAAKTDKSRRDDTSLTVGFSLRTDGWTDNTTKNPAGTTLKTPMP